jgi:hypothetical protein
VSSHRNFHTPIFLDPRATMQKLQTWPRITKMDCERGARLLLDFKSIAADELQYTKIEIPPLARRPPKLLPRIATLIPCCKWDDSESEEPSDVDLSPSKRLRTVSVSFDESPMSPLPASPTHSFDSSCAASSPRSPNSAQSAPTAAVTPEGRPKILVDLPNSSKPTTEVIQQRPSSSKPVGTKVKGRVKAVLQRKFSWKNYLALENYLVEHRNEYLQYSSELNYTAEQKLYNNKLTQGLLDLAEQEGYQFEDFTFAAIRDRIRCYYKSYVQANKKKKKRKRGSSKAF